MRKEKSAGVDNIPAELIQAGGEAVTNILKTIRSGRQEIGLLHGPNQWLSHNRIQEAIGPYGDIMPTVTRRKLKWYGHVSRTSGLTKTIPQGTVRGARRRRQRKRWEDNIREWTGLDFSETHRAADDRQRWRYLVARSSVVRQRHSGLRD